MTELGSGCNMPRRNPPPANPQPAVWPRSLLAANLKPAVWPRSLLPGSVETSSFAAQTTCNYGRSLMQLFVPCRRVVAEGRSHQSPNLGFPLLPSLTANFLWFSCPSPSLGLCRYYVSQPYGAFTYKLRGLRWLEMVFKKIIAFRQ